MRLRRRVLSPSEPLSESARRGTSSTPRTAPVRVIVRVIVRVSKTGTSSTPRNAPVRVIVRVIIRVSKTGTSSTPRTAPVRVIVRVSKTGASSTLRTGLVRAIIRVIKTGGVLDAACGARPSHPASWRGCRWAAHRRPRPNTAGPSRLRRHTRIYSRRALGPCVTRGAAPAPRVDQKPSLAPTWPLCLGFRVWGLGFGV